MTIKLPLYRTKRIEALYDTGQIPRTVKLACESVRPPLVTVGDIRDYLIEHGSFSDIPGCRRPGRVTQIITEIAENVSDPPEDYEGYSEDIPFGFVGHDKRNDYETYRDTHGHYPMFRILVDFLNSNEADRHDIIFGMHNGLPGNVPLSYSEIASRVHLTKERVRQICTNYRLPERIGGITYWTPYGDYSTYYIDDHSECFRNVVETEIDTINFTSYANVLSRILMLEFVQGRFLVRSGWENEIISWVKRLEQIAALPRTKDSRISIDGLAMSGVLDIRLKQIIISQIAPSLGITAIAPDILIFHANSTTGS